jgi:hypothetical protein
MFKNGQFSKNGHISTPRFYRDLTVKCLFVCQAGARAENID